MTDENSIFISLADGNGGGVDGSAIAVAEIRQRPPHVTRSRDDDVYQRPPPPIQYPMGDSFFTNSTLPRTDMTPKPPSMLKKGATAIKRFFRSAIAPTENDKYDESVSQRGFVSRLCHALGALFILLFTVGVMLLIIDIAVAPKADISKTFSARMLLRRDNVVITPSIVLPSGVVVHEVLNPEGPLETIGQVSVLMRKIRELPGRRVSKIDLPHISKRYLTYKYVSPHDTDAKPISVNATFDKLVEVMRSNLPQLSLCEGLIHYGIEKNAIYIQSWNTPPPIEISNETVAAVVDAFIYNPQILERSSKLTDRVAAIAAQEKCRISEIILADTGRISTIMPADSKKQVPESATLEYTTDSGNKKLRVIQQPLLACVEHVLKLSGFPVK